MEQLIERVAAQTLDAEIERMTTWARNAGGAGEPLSDLLRHRSGAPGDLSSLDPASTPGVNSRRRAESELALLTPRLSGLQERLFAAARGGESQHRILLILQGMDTAGKGGVVKRIAGQLDPNGLRVSAFTAPTEQELAHDFLWRIRAAAPGPGLVGVFDRSHYEDVLVARVRGLAAPAVIGRRYGAINRFERELIDDGCVLVKCLLHISADEQKRRLLARLDDPTKRWKYDPNDAEDRKRWPEYQKAYQVMLQRTSTDIAPWHVVPADRKWYRDYAIIRLLVETLERVNPQYPSGGFDPTVERDRIINT